MRHLPSSFIILFLFPAMCLLSFGDTVSGNVCQKAQYFVVKRNETIDVLLSQRYLENIPFKQEEVLPPFVHYSENYLVEPKYNILSCNIPKILSTIRVGLFWLLHNQTSYNAANYTLSSGDWDLLSSLSAAQVLLSPGNTKFMMYRDPIERFVSAYTDKCINSGYCYHCKRNISCYAEEQYRRFMLFSKGVLLDTDHGMEDYHFAPQTWFCNLGVEFYNYKKIKYEYGKRLEIMVGDVIEVLRDACVEEQLLRRIRSEMMEGKTGHTTRGSASRSRYEDEIRNNPATAALLMKMYYYDYVAFGYPLPAAAVL